MSPNPSQSSLSEVQIRYIDPANVVDTGLIAQMHTWLDSTEKARLQRYKQADHRHTFLVSHALTRKMLGKAIGCAPADIRLGVTGRDKPVLLAPSHEVPLHFNLSHTSGLAVVAMSEQPVGVDVEHLTRKAPGPDLAKRYFTAAEHQDIESQPDSLRQERFLMYWTLKEAFLKAQSWGIVDSLKGFEFELTPARIRLRVRDAKLTPTHPWRFHHWQLPSAHMISLARSARLGPEPSIDIRAWSEDDWQ